ncbi:PREDICTED: uncharacterized protein LOC109186562 [Ipomoea nil]|uniref:uncharacterized protein LOC109186562 n=1 Tax=Ipomoea nil TaxID=35883 RepID=UPI000901D16C|nr:PREDICTED: uncharacterized protein LOC109186562 [Ipomoea nil]
MDQSGVADDSTLGQFVKSVKKRTTRAVLSSQAAELTPAQEDQAEPSTRQQPAAVKRKRAPPQKRERVRDPDVNYFSTRMGPKQMYDLVQRLTHNQKDAVIDMGFGGLLHLQFSSNYSQLVEYLLQRFDVFKSDFILDGDHLHVGEEDVEYILGLPRGKRDVEEGTKSEENSTAAYNKVLTEWRKRWNVRSGSPITTKMPDEIIRRGDHGDAFKRDFVVFAVSSLLRGNTGRYANYRVIKSLLNIRSISRLNWCKYTYNSLIDSYDIYKDSPTRSFGGPMVFILLFYFDRVQFRGMTVNRTFPAIKAWTKSLVRKRVSAEIKSGGFGKGKVIPRFQRPTAIASTSSPRPAPPPAAIPRPVSSPAATPTIPAPSVPLTNVDRVTNVLQRLTAGVLEFGQVMSDIGKQGAPVEIMKRAFSGISTMLSAASTIQPTPSPTASQLDDIFFGSESFTSAIDSLVAAFEKTRKEMEIEVPSFELLGRSTPTPPPSQQQPLDTLVDNIVRSAGVSTSTEKEATPLLIRVPFEKSTTPTTPAAQTAAEIDEFDKAMDESESDVEDVTVRKRPVRKFRNIPLHLRSPYWNKNKGSINNATPKEKVFSNYAFLEASSEHPGGETLFKYGDYYFTRDDFATMCNGELLSSFLDVWSLRFTLLNMPRAVGETKRVYFSTLVHLQIDPNDQWMKDLPTHIKMKNFNERLSYEITSFGNLDISDADLIFFAVHRHGHYFLVCFNVKEHKVQVIDNKELPASVSEKDKYGNCPHLLYLKLDWANTENVTDCGIYVLRHMETFRGTLQDWQPGFKKNMRLNASFMCELRAKYAANLIKWRMNEVRGEVLQAAKRVSKKN